MIEVLDSGHLWLSEPMGIISELFDDRDVIGIDGTVLGEGGGGIHCITQQVPKPTV